MRWDIHVLLNWLISSWILKKLSIKKFDIQYSVLFNIHLYMIWPLCFCSMFNLQNIAGIKIHIQLEFWKTCGLVLISIQNVNFLKYYYHMYLRTPEFNFVSRNIWLWINETSPSCVLLWKNSNVGWCNSTPFDLIFAWTTFLFQIFTSCCHRKWTKSGHFEVFFKITQLLFLYVYNVIWEKPLPSSRTLII